MSDQTLSNRNAALCSGAAPTRLTMPHLTINQTSVNQTPAAPAAQPLANMSTLNAALPSFVPKTFDPSRIGDPATMSAQDKTALKEGPKIDIFTRRTSQGKEPGAWIQANEKPVHAKVLCAFSTKAKRQLAALKLGQSEQIFLENVSPAAIRLMTGYLYAVCSPGKVEASSPIEASNKKAKGTKQNKTSAVKDSEEAKPALEHNNSAKSAVPANEGDSASDKTANKAKLPTIHTRKLGWEDYVYLWKMAEDLDMPLIIDQLKFQMFKDLAPEPAEVVIKLHQTAVALKVTTPQKNFAGRLWSLAKNDLRGPQLTVADVNALIDAAPLDKVENIDQVAITTFAHSNWDPLTYNDETKLKGAYESFKTPVMERWNHWHEVEVRKKQAAVNRKKEQRKREAEALWGVDPNTGEVKAFAPMTLWSPRESAW